MVLRRFHTMVPTRPKDTAIVTATSGVAPVAIARDVPTTPAMPGSLGIAPPTFRNPRTTVLIVAPMIRPFADPQNQTDDGAGYERLANGYVYDSCKPGW